MKVSMHFEHENSKIRKLFSMDQILHTKKLLEALRKNSSYGTPFGTIFYMLRAIFSSSRKDFFNPRRLDIVSWTFANRKIAHHKGPFFRFRRARNARHCTRETCDEQPSPFDSASTYMFLRKEKKRKKRFTHFYTERFCTT